MALLRAPVLSGLVLPRLSTDGRGLSRLLENPRVTSRTRRRAQAGETVRVHLTGRLDDGSVFQETNGAGPLEITLGQGALLPALEAAIAGMPEGTRQTVTVSWSEAHGPWREDLVHTVPRDSLPEGVTPRPGLRLAGDLDDGTSHMVTILTVEDDTVTLDANHPLAGEDLIFTVRLLKVL